MGSVSKRMSSNKIVLSPNDKRSYRRILLDNNLEAMLISDPNSQKSSACLSISIGSIYDTYPGIAHFLEHMLFMGSEKYPDENLFGETVTKYTGSTNAFTTDDITSYFFDCTPAGFFETLDIFAQFFVSPILKPDAVDREINAVHSEFVNSETNESFLFERIIQKIMKPNHPLSTFTCGNLSTLQVDGIRDKVKMFYDTYYSSHLMKLVVIGVESLDTLENQVRASFSDVPHRSVEIIETLPPILTPCYIRYIPMIDTKTLVLCWELKYKSEWNYHHTITYIATIIGDEGPGSLADTLKCQFYAQSVTAGEYTQYKDRFIFQIYIRLTDKGFDDLNTVLGICKTYITSISNQTYDNYKIVYDDQALAYKIKFLNLIQGDACNYVVGLSNMWARNPHIPYQHIVSYEYMFNDYNPQVHQYVIDNIKSLTFDRVSILVGSQSFSKTDLEFHTDEYYTNIRYNMTDVPVIDHVVTDLPMHIPEHNDYLIADPKIYPNIDSNFPTRLACENMNIWFKHDTSYNVPDIDANITIEFIDKKTLHDLLMSEIIIKCINHAMNAKIYTMANGGYIVKLYQSDTGLSFSVQGYNEKFNDIMEYLIINLATISLDRDTYNNIKLNIKQQLENDIYTPPYKRTISTLNRELVSGYFSCKDKLSALDEIRFEDILDWRSKMFTGKLSISGLIYGNITHKQAMEVINLLESLTINATMIVKRKLLPDNNLHTPVDGVFIEHHKNPKEKNTCVALTFPIGYTYRDVSTESIACMKVLCGLLSDRFFDTLRTHEQLGYIVQAFMTNLDTYYNRYNIFQFRVQSSLELKDGYLVDRITEYLTEFRNELVDIPEEKLDKLIESCIQTAEKSLVSQNLYEVSGKLMLQIFAHHETLDVVEREIGILKRIRKEDLITIYDKYIFNNPRHILILQPDDQNCN